MAYFAAGAAVASVVGGIASSRSAKKLAKEQQAIQRESLAFNKQRYADNKAIYGELEKQVVSSAQKGVVADLGGVTSRAAADVKLQFANTEGARLRNAQRMGINPNSGRADSMARQAGTAEALAAAGNITASRETERRDALDKTFTRQFAVNQLGVQQMNGAAGDINNSNAALATTYGNAAAAKAAQAGSFFSTAGQIAGIGLGQMGGATTPATPATPPPLISARSPTTPAYVSPKDTAFNNLYSAIKY
jgi:hypothetical protein